MNLNKLRDNSNNILLYSIIGMVVTLLLNIVFNISINVVTIVVSLFLLIISGVLIINRNNITLLYLSIFVLFQNFLLVILSPYINNNIFNIIILHKEIIVYAIVFIVGIKAIYYKKINTTDIIAFSSLIIFTLFLLFKSKNTFMASVASYRQYIMLFTLYLFGRFIVIDKEQFITFIKQYKNYIIITCLIGIVIYLMNESLWVTLGINDFAQLKGLSDKSVNELGIPKSFYTYDFWNIFGIRVKRLVSTLVDPVIYSQIVAIALLFSIFLRDKFKSRRNLYLTIALFSITLVLTLGKGGGLIFFIGALFGLYFIEKKKKLTLYVILFGLACAIVVIATQYSHGTSIAKHLNGLLQNLQYIAIEPWGHGLGVNGNFANTFGNANFTKIGASESFVGKVIVEVGLLGLLSYTLFIGSLIYSLRDVLNEKDDIISKISIICLGSLLGIIVASFLSVSSMSFTGCTFVLSVLGVITTMKKQQKID